MIDTSEDEWVWNEDEESWEIASDQEDDIDFDDY